MDRRCKEGCKEGCKEDRGIISLADQRWAAGYVQRFWVHWLVAVVWTFFSRIAESLWLTWGLVGSGKDRFLKWGSLLRGSMALHM